MWPWVPHWLGLKMQAGSSQQWTGPRYGDIHVLGPPLVLPVSARRVKLWIHVCLSLIEQFLGVKRIGIIQPGIL